MILQSALPVDLTKLPAVHAANNTGGLLFNGLPSSSTAGRNAAAAGGDMHLAGASCSKRAINTECKHLVSLDL